MTLLRGIGPGGRHSRQPSARDVLGIGIGAVALLALTYGVAWWHLRHAFPGDTLTYYLAGLRLNTGHLLYDLGPDDVWLYDNPEFPLFGPPLIAVIWRPLAALPGGWGMVLWLVAMSFATAYAVAYVLLGTRGLGGLLLVPLTPSLTLLMGVANVDAVVLVGFIAVWVLMTRNRPIAAGLTIGLLVSLKLTPAVLLVWMVATRRWVAIAWAAATVVVLGVVAMLLTEPGIWARYARVMVDGASTGRSWGLLVLIVGFVLVLLTHRRPALSFAVAVALVPLGSPQAAIHTWSLLVASLAPLTDRVRSPAHMSPLARDDTA